MITPTQLKAEIEQRVGQDPDFAAMYNNRNDSGMAASLSVGRTRLTETMLTERSVISTLGIVDGETALASLEAFVASTPTSPDMLQVQPGIKRMLGWLKTTGVDVGNPITQSMLDLLGTAGILDTNSVNTLKTMAIVPDVITANQVSEAIDHGL